MKKSAGIRLTACLLAASLAGAPLPAAAETVQLLKEKITVNPAGEKEGKPAADIRVSLEKAIQIAREKVFIPEGLDKFSSEYSEYNGRGQWMLRWYSPGPYDSNMHVTVNAATGEVDNISLYKSVIPGTRYKGLPAFSREQCLQIAREQAAKLAPDKYSSTVPVERPEWREVSIFHDRDYPVVYEFSFRRTSGGIPVTDQGINVGINAETGELVRFDASWFTDVKLPPSQGKIGPEEARKIFAEKSGYELTYFRINGDDPDSPGELRLVYRLKPPGRFILNALTGEVIDTRLADFYIDEMYDGGYGGERMQSSKAYKVSLTPAENKAVKEITGLISADRAQELAGQLVGVPKGYTVTNRSLDRHHGIPGSRVWSINFSDPENKKWIRVSLDARSGGLLSFYKDVSFNYEEMYKEPQVKVTPEEARKTADQYVKNIQPARAAQVVFRESENEIGPWIKLGKRVPRAYTFVYGRMVNGIVYPENGFRVRVDSLTGEITLYDMTWWDAAFPKADGVIDVKTANDKALSEHPLVLEYGRAHKRFEPEREPSYYLIYRMSGFRGFMLDARSGEEIDYSGKPVEKKGKQPFSDISGHPAEKDILLLAGEGIVTGSGGLFRPDDGITGAEMLAMLVKAFSNRGPFYPLNEAGKEEPWHKPVFDSARARGILDEGFSPGPDDGVNRLQLSRLGINAGGWGKLARLSNIFRLEVSDGRSIPEEYRGYAASAAAMGLIELENGKFNPERAVTRGEAAIFLVKLLKQ
ncbi:MAG: S-layer homology domain-containing protein [Bacillota bacterium]